MEVVDQPLGRGGDGRACADGLGDIVIGREQHSLIVGEPLGQRGALHLDGRHRLRSGEAACVFFQTLDAEELSPDGGAVVP